MFTGLVEEVAVLRSMEHNQHSAHLRIAAQRVLEGIRVGDSISVNGACLTVVAFDRDSFTADAVPETMRRSNLGKLRPGSKVNVERAMALGDRLGGHMVSGHVDGVGEIVELQQDDIAIVLTVRTSPDVMHYVVEKGSICVDGVSLTVMDTTGECFRISIIPHTGQHTTLADVCTGTMVNLECDLIAKYVEKMILPHTSRGTDDSAAVRGSRMDLKYLREHGFA